MKNAALLLSRQREAEKQVPGFMKTAAENAPDMRGREENRIRRSAEARQTHPIPSNSAVNR